MEEQSEAVCLRCDGMMEPLGTKRILLRRSNLLTEADNFIISDSVELNVYKCRKCGRLEFYSILRPEEICIDDTACDYSDEEGEHITQVICPNCGNLHDLDYIRCPFCGERR